MLTFALVLLLARRPVALAWFAALVVAVATTGSA